MTDSRPHQMVTLGKDIQISALGVGAWAWGDQSTWGYGKNYDDADLRSVFDTSVQAGINFFDTAEIYGMGRSERLLGEFIRASGQQIVITTKFFPFPWRWRKQALIRALNNSVQRLGVSQVDLYLIHWPAPPVPFTVWMDAMADAVAQGLTRLVGVSNFNAAQMRQAHATLAKRDIPLTANQFHYSLLKRAPERNGLLDACRELGVVPVAYSPLEMGLLTGKYDASHRPPGTRKYRYSSGLLERIQPLISLLREIGSAHGDTNGARTPAQVALNWVIAKGAVPIPGAKNIRQAASNAGALGWSLTPDEVAALDEASNQFI